MKKLCSMLLVMFLLTGTAFAGGLGGLNGAGSGNSGGGLSGLAATKAYMLPDPCLAFSDEHMMEFGTLYMADYQFSDEYLCDAYFYPYQERTFYTRYATVAKDFGYTMTQTTVDGMAGYSIQRGDGLEALMVPDFNDGMLFLVEKGMDFQLMNILSCTMDGVAYTMTVYGMDNPEFLGNWIIRYWNSSDPINWESFVIGLPKYAKAGDYFEKRQKSAKVEGLTLDYNRFGDTLRLLYGAGYLSDGITNSRDYAVVTVTRRDETPYGTLFAGTFEGRFFGGEHIIEGGTFCGLIEE